MGVSVEWAFWPGDFEECLLNLGPEEAVILSEADLSKPAVGLVEGRVLIPLEGVDQTMKPGFVFLEDNDNPALRVFEAYILGLSDA